MFQNLANYLLGSVLNQPITEDAPSTAAANQPQNDLSQRLRSEDREDDWVLVLRDSEDFVLRDAEDHALRDGEDSEGERPLSRTGSAGMEESWFVTPPPCFTSEGPVHMETSPLENLLIEHPSMSVYHIHPRGRHFVVAVPVRSVSADSYDSHGEESEEEEIEELEGQPVVVAVANRLPRLNRLQVLQQQEKQGHKSKRAQKIQMQKACQSLKRGNLERNNKAREVNSRNRRQRRGERSQGPTRSHANNNRKC